MKKPLIIAIALAVVAGLAWLIWFQPAKPEAEAVKPATEVPVQVAKIVRTTLRGYVTAYGTVEPEPAGERPAASARVGTAVPGIVTEVKCAAGQSVNKGTVLFQLDSRTADVAVQTAEKVLARQKQLMLLEGTSQKVFQEAEQQLTAAYAQQSLLRIQSPLAGMVTSVNVRPGEAVDLTTVLAEVLDPSRLVVSVNVPNSELATLKSGQAAAVRVNESAAPVTATVNYVSPQVEAKTGTALVRATLPANSGLRAGEFVTLRIVSEEHKDCLAVPVESVVKNAEGGMVIAVVENDRATQTPVKAGLRDGEWVEVQADGLQAGMTVVAVGAYGLPQETKIRVVEK
jgi:membrane fusion protein (multidrug efflux system)